jgi:hypothetical protein
MLKGDIVLKANYLSPITGKSRSGAEWLEFANDYSVLDFVLEDLILLEKS